MRYPDLAPHITVSENPQVLLNVGWLDGCFEYQQGATDFNLMLKLLTLTLFNLDQRPIAKQFGRHQHPRNIVVHTNHRQGSPFNCPYCHIPIQLIDDQSRVMYLGRNDMHLPNADRSIIFRFPTLLYHYMIEHNYLPPVDFLNALAAFNLNKSYDCKRIQF